MRRYRCKDRYWDFKSQTLYCTTEKIYIFFLKLLKYKNLKPEHVRLQQYSVDGLDYFSSTHEAFSVFLSSCSARRWSSALRARAEHIPPPQKEPSRARLQSVITVKIYRYIHALQKKKKPETTASTDRPVLSPVLEAASPVLRAAPTITREERRHIVARIPRGTPPGRDLLNVNSRSDLLQVFLNEKFI